MHVYPLLFAVAFKLFALWPEVIYSLSILIASLHTRLIRMQPNIWSDTVPIKNN